MMDGLFFQDGRSGAEAHWETHCVLAAMEDNNWTMHSLRIVVYNGFWLQEVIGHVERWRTAEV